MNSKLESLLGGKSPVVTTFSLRKAWFIIDSKAHLLGNSGHIISEIDESDQMPCL